MLLTCCWLADCWGFVGVYLFWFRLVLLGLSCGFFDWFYCWYGVACVAVLLNLSVLFFTGYFGLIVVGGLFGCLLSLGRLFKRVCVLGWFGMCL